MSSHDLKPYWGKQPPNFVCRACKKSGKKPKQTRIEQAVAVFEKSKDCIKCRFPSQKMAGGWCAKCRESHPSEFKTYKNQERHRRCMANPGAHLHMVMRISIRQCLKGEKKRRKTFDLVGYTVEELKKHLERLFLPGMSWSNYGGRGGWHIDHIIPLSRLNITSPEDQDFRRAWALNNLRPLWGRDNIARGNRCEFNVQPSLSFGEVGHGCRA